jgi:uncharacterized membrane protein
MHQHQDPMHDPRDLEAAPPLPAERTAAVWVSRLTSVLGLLCLAIALSVWAARPGHFRFVLAMLIIAMFAAVLHSYTFENGNGG